MTTTEAATATQVYQLYIKASQEKVWDAITNPEIVAKFFQLVGDALGLPTLGQFRQCCLRGTHPSGRRRGRFGVTGAAVIRSGIAMRTEKANSVGKNWPSWIRCSVKRGPPMEPYALSANEAGQALSPVMGTTEVAWPVEELDLDWTHQGAY
jgi:hypothetical protein